MATTTRTVRVSLKISANVVVEGKADREALKEALRENLVMQIEELDVDGECDNAAGDDVVEWIVDSMDVT